MVISRKLLGKSSENDFICILHDYVSHASSKNSKKIAILKILEQVSFWGVKTHFGKLALKGCIFRQEKQTF